MSVVYGSRRHQNNSVPSSSRILCRVHSNVGILEKVCWNWWLKLLYHPAEFYLLVAISSQWSRGQQHSHPLWICKAVHGESTVTENAYNSCFIKTIHKQVIQLAANTTLRLRRVSSISVHTRVANTFTGNNWTIPQGAMTILWNSRLLAVHGLLREGNEHPPCLSARI